jgi:endonuclease III
MARRAVNVTRLKRLYGRLRRAAGAVALPPPTDPTDELVVALLLEGTTERKAVSAMRRLKRAFVDYNEVRVTRTSEIAEVIGPLPAAAAKSHLIPQVLNALFDRFHRAGLEPLAELPRRDARKFLEEAAGPVAAARIMLMSFSSHAVPADDAMRNLLAAEEVIDPKIDPVRLQTALERHIKTSEAYAFYRLLRDHAEAGGARHAAGKAGPPKPTEKKPVKKKPTKRSEKRR